MSNSSSFFNCFLLIAITFSSLASAEPFYYWYQAAEPPKDAAQQSANQISQAIGDGAAGQVGGQNTEQLPDRIHNHLNQLYQHSSTAVKSLADQVQPDIRNIGQDLSEAYHVTRENVGRRIEPLAQTVRPYIDHAQKVVAPYIHQVEEEVPKLIHQAGPAMARVGEQVRDGITGVWHRVTANGNPTSDVTGQQTQSLTQNVADGGQQVAQQANQQQVSVQAPNQLSAPAQSTAA